MIWGLEEMAKEFTLSTLPRKRNAKAHAPLATGEENLIVFGMY